MWELDASLQQFGEFILKAQDEDGRTNPLGALEQLRMRIRTRHYSYRTECSYADWVRRFLAHLAEREGTPRARVDSESVRDYLTTEHVQNLKRHLHDRAPKTVNNVLAVLNVLLKKAWSGT